MEALDSFYLVTLTYADKKKADTLFYAEKEFRHTIYKWLVLKKPRKILVLPLVILIIIIGIRITRFFLLSDAYLRRQKKKQTHYFTQKKNSDTLFING